MKQRVLRVGLAIAVAVAVGVGFYVRFHAPPPRPTLAQASVTTGDVVEGVVSTGTLQALRTVSIGTQISGKVQRIYVDFNSLVKKGDLLAQLDPALMQQALDSAQASVDQATITLGSDQAVLDADQRILDREQELFDDEQSTAQERETAELQVKTDEAKVDVDNDAVRMAQAGVTRARVNLGYCTVRSPIDGVVIARNVDEGQTVAASFATPTLFTLATTLTSLQLIGNVDEADVARLRPGQHVMFTVDAYRGTEFPGTVSEVRLNATSTNNVVTYQVVIDVQNPERRLLPGMTSNLTIQISHVANVTRVPAEALRFRPSPEMFAALGQLAPPAAKLSAVSARTLSRARRVEPRAADATSIDAMFAPVSAPVSSSQVWVWRDGRLAPIDVQVGASDATWAQLISGDLKPGDQVVTGITLPLVKRPGAFSPLVPPSRSRSSLRRMR